MLQFAVAVIEPPYPPYPAAKLAGNRKVHHETDFERAAEADTASQKNYGAAKPADAFRLRFTVAGELVGAWRHYGGQRAHSANLADVVSAEVVANREQPPDLYRRKPRIGDGRDIKLIKSQLEGPRE